MTHLNVANGNLNSSNKLRCSQVSGKSRRPLNSKGGILYGDSLKLLFQKLNIAENEMNQISKRSISYSRSVVAKYKKLSKEKANYFHEMAIEMARNNLLPSAALSVPILRIPSIEVAAVPPVNRTIGGSVMADGSGTGLYTQHFGGNDDQTDVLTVSVTFANLRVPNDGYYIFTLPISVFYNSLVIADDGACTSKEGWAAMRLFGTLSQDYNGQLINNPQFPQPVTRTPTYTSFGNDSNNGWGYFADGQNINQQVILQSFGKTIFNQDLNPIWLSKDFDVNIQGLCDAETYAKGEGSHADIEFNVYCEDLQVNQVLP